MMEEGGWCEQSKEGQGVRRGCCDLWAVEQGGHGLSYFCMPSKDVAGAVSELSLILESVGAANVHVHDLPYWCWPIAIAACQSRNYIPSTARGEGVGCPFLAPWITATKVPVPLCRGSNTSTRLAIVMSKDAAPPPSCRLAGSVLVAAKQQPPLYSEQAYFLAPPASTAHTTSDTTTATAATALATTLHVFVPFRDDAGPTHSKSDQQQKDQQQSRDVTVPREAPGTSQLCEVAYTAATSGSRGSPQIVACSQSAVASMLRGISQHIVLSNDDVVAIMSPSTFDPHILDAKLAFKHGCTMVTFHDSVKPSSRMLLQAFVALGVSYACIVPTIFQQMLAGHAASSESSVTFPPPHCRLRNLLVGGEPFPSPNTVLYAWDWTHPCRLWNIYGVTERAMWQLLCPVTRGALGMCAQQGIAAPIGFPLHGVVAQLRSEVEDDAVPAGNEGYLLVGGEARTCSIAGKQSNGLWNTGDLCACISDPTLVATLRGAMPALKGDSVPCFAFCGRTDDMIKCRGKRIHLNDIAHHIEHNSRDTLHAVPVVYQQASGQVIVCVRVTKPSSTGPDANHHEHVALGSALKQLNADVSRRFGVVISAIVSTSHLHTTAHGKVDTRHYRELVEHAKEAAAIGHEPQTQPAVQGHGRDNQAKHHDAAAEGQQTHYKDPQWRRAVSVLNCALLAAGLQMPALAIALGRTTLLTQAGGDSLVATEVARLLEAAIAADYTGLVNALLNSTLHECALILRPSVAAVDNRRLVQACLDMLLPALTVHCGKQPSPHQRVMDAESKAQLVKHAHLLIEDPDAFDALVTSRFQHVRHSKGAAPPKNPSHQQATARSPGSRISYTRECTAEVLEQPAKKPKSKAYKPSQAERTCQPGAQEPTSCLPPGVAVARLLVSRVGAGTEPVSTADRIKDMGHQQHQGWQQQQQREQQQLEAAAVLEPGAALPATVVANIRGVSDWAYDARACVDASPTLYVPHARAVDAPRAPLRRVYIGSHAGVFACINAVTGECLWEHTLADRIESSACISGDGRFVIVGCYNGDVVSFDAVTGQEHMRFCAADAVRSPIRADPTHHCLMFAACYDGNVYVADLSARSHFCATSLAQATKHSGGNDSLAPLAAPPCLMTATGVAITPRSDEASTVHERAAHARDSLCITASLCGRVTCFSFSYAGGTWRERLLWTHKASHPIFAAPVAAPASTAHAPPCVLVCVVNGTVLCMHAATGEIAWQYAMGVDLFAGPLVLSGPSQRGALPYSDVKEDGDDGGGGGGRNGSDDHSGNAHGGGGDADDRRPSLWSVVLCGKAGRVVKLDSWGQMRWTCNLGSDITANAVLVRPFGTPPSTRCLAILTTNGRLFVMSPKDGAYHFVTHVGSHVFGAPAAWEGNLYLGTRDDKVLRCHLYL